MNYYHKTIMIINLSYKNKIIQSKDVHYPDNIDALTWMINAFKHNFNIDIYTECEICGHPIPQHLIVKRP
jgi:hypothetical protein